MNILIHGTILGYGGIGHHTREFSKYLSKYHNVKIRNYNLVDLEDWKGYTGPDILKNAKHLEDCHHSMLYQQTLMDGDLKDFPLSGYDDSFVPDIHIIMAEVNHYYYYNSYKEPTVAYFAWETTHVMPNFLERLNSMDYIWCPSEWQKEMLVKNGIDSEKIDVVNEGVDPSKFFPIQRNNQKITFLHIGTWEYRKSTYEIIKSFQNVFGESSDVELRLSIHNKLRYQENPIDNFKKYNLILSDNIKILETLSEEEYVREIQNADFYLSCSRGEGWNLPLIQSLSCGVPSVYSRCGGQLEFTKSGIGIGIEIIGEFSARRVRTIHGNNYYWESIGDYSPNYLFEPNYGHLEEEIKNYYNSFLEGKVQKYISKGIEDSKYIHDNFNWDYIAKKSCQILSSYNLNKKIIHPDSKNMSNIYYLIHSPNWGDTFLSTPTLRYLSKSHREKINVVTHRKDIFKNNPYVDNILSFDEYHSMNLSGIVKYESFTHAGGKDGNGIEKKFSHFDGRQLHASDLGFQLPISDLDYDFFPDPLGLDIELPERYVVLHVTTNWPNRTWKYDNWVQLIKWLKDNQIYTVLIGSGYREELHHSFSDKPLDKECPLFEDYYGLDLTNKGTMSDMYWVIGGSQAIVTMDSAPLHLSSCTDTHIIQLGSAINPEFKRFYRNGDWKYKYHFLGGSCKLFCNTNLFYNVREWGDINSVPPQPNCLENKPTFECHPKLNDVIDKLKDILLISKREENFSLEEDNTPIVFPFEEEKIKFGIYTSFYNSEKFIDQIFENIEKINYSNFEWHITDDFSSDSTKEKLLKRLSKSPIKNRIKYMEQTEKKQMYWKPNLFFDESFDWIILIDCDDTVDPECLKVYNSVVQEREDISLISSDFHKINEKDGSLHSISYIHNDDKISKKIERYHPSCDYLNNISYSCFGHLRGFKHDKIPSFEITNSLACAEDSYHVFWSNSYGKYLHVPRPLYRWILRGDSESHNTDSKPGFNDNFEISLNKLKGSDYGTDSIFNDVYIETSAMGSYEIGGLKNKKVSIWSRNLSSPQKDKIKILYPDSELVFNDYGGEINIVCLNYFSSGDLDDLLSRISKNKILFYYQNQKIHLTNEQKEKELSDRLEYFLDTIKKYVDYSWWTYIRHFIIKT